MQEESCFICLYLPQNTSIVIFPLLVPLLKQCTSSNCDRRARNRAIMPKSWHIKSWFPLARGENQFSVPAILLFLADALRLCQIRQMTAANNGCPIFWSAVFTLVSRFPAVTFHAKIASRDLAAGHPLILHCVLHRHPLEMSTGGFVIVVKPVQCYLKHTHTIVTLILPKLCVVFVLSARTC